MWKRTNLMIVLAAGWLSAACGGKAAVSPEEPEDLRLVEIIATEHDFNPEQIIAEPGQALIVQLRNEGTVAHGIGFELPDAEPALEQLVAPQQTARLRFTAPTRPGEYAFYGAGSDARERGMQGTLIVRRPPAVRLEEVAAGAMTAPVAMAAPPDDSGRRLIVDQIGVIRILMPDGTLREEPFLDIRDEIVELNPMYDERGLLGLAFHPEYARNGRFFIYYSAPLRRGAPDAWDHTNRVAELTVSPDDPNRADRGSERLVLAIDLPQTNHNGGTLAFGPEDGYLYISVGDGGGADDDDLGHTPGLGNGQDVTNLLGSILRIDVDGAEPYAIPPDNPFVGRTGRAEIFAYGLRNPYRFSFEDSEPVTLLVGDAGQHLWEEVSLVTRGGNYGWRRLEGTHCFDHRTPRVSPPVCEEIGPLGEPLQWPVAELPNAKQVGGMGAVVVGGYRYRGQAIQPLAGRYVFGVWNMHEHDHAHEPSGQLLVASDVDGAGDDLWPVERIHVSNGRQGTLDRYLLGLWEDDSGELYVLTNESHGPRGSTGKVFRLVPG